MGDLNNETSALDQAAQQPIEQTQEYFTNVKKFLSSSFTSAITLFICILISFYILYCTKVAQSNILPTDKNCYPYTRNKPVIDTILINIFSTSWLNTERKSMKLKFPDYKNSLLDSLLTSFRNYKENPKSSFLGNYIVAIIESFFQSNYYYYSVVFSLLNALPETLIILIGPILGFFILFLGVVIGCFSFLYNWLSNLSWMWKKNANIRVNQRTGQVTNEGPPLWVDVTWKSPDPADPKKSEWVSCILALFLIIFFINVLFILFAAQGVLIFSVAMNFFTILTFFMYRMKFGPDEGQMHYSSANQLIMYFFKYNKFVVMVIFSIMIVMNASNDLGKTAAGFAILTLFLIYWFSIIEMFVPVKAGVTLARGKYAEDIGTAPREECEEPKKIFNDLAEGETTATFGDRFRMSTTSKDSLDAAKTSAPPVPSAPPAPAPPTGGSSKPLQIGGDNLIRELKKFHKKYHAIL